MGEGKGLMPNRLATEKSPYLRQHAENPVDWLPWGAEALARAAAEQKPIFLSIGYSSCHWCHVMAHESFENAAVAEALNRDFIPVKVDREERPDVDRVYMTYVQQTTGRGGWPMSVWLTPRLHPFYGGTYFPPDDRHGRPGFLTLLQAIARHWREQRARIESGAADVVAALQRHALEGGPREEGPGDPAPLSAAAVAAVESAFGYFHEAYDPQWGGFGDAPKFPRASVINLLFRVAAQQGLVSPAGAAAVEMATHTLRRMAEGGLHDHVGGGFHRYSVDEKWHVPHFEKMLYDQAQIALNYLDAHRATGREVFAWIARDIFDYVRRDLTGPHGAFLSAEDADSLPRGGAPGGHGGRVEGAFYVWTREELDAALGPEAEFFCRHYGVEPGGNVESDPSGELQGKNVLHQGRSLAATAKEFKLELPAAEARLLACLATLRGVRAGRPRPELDDKVITAWNGLMISALAAGAAVLDEPALAAAAARAADFLQRELFDEPTATLFRSWRGGRSDVPGFAEDYACLIQGLLDLYEATFAIRWLQWAERLQAEMDRRFWDGENGGYFNSRADDATVIVRLKEDHDGAEPAPNSVAVSNLLRLDWMLGFAGAREKALRTAEATRRQWSRVPQALPQMLIALEMAVMPPRSIVLAGEPAAEDFRALAMELARRPGRCRVLMAADGGAAQRWLAERRPDLAALRPVDGRAAAYVCDDFACQAPVTEPAALRRLLG